MNQHAFLEMKLSQAAKLMGHMDSVELFSGAIRAIRHHVERMADSEEFRPNKFLVEFGGHGCYLTTDPNGHFIPLPFQQCTHHFTEDEANHLADMINLLMGSGTVRTVKVGDAYQSALNELTKIGKLELHEFLESENNCSAEDMIRYASACSLLQAQRSGSTKTQQTANSTGCLVWMLLVPGIIVTAVSFVTKIL